MYKHSRILIILLALVLPAQGLAAALLHCQLLEAASSAALAIHHPDSSAVAECHGAGDPRMPDSSQDQSPGAGSSQAHQHADAQPEGTDCVHCAATCHGMQIVILAELPDASTASPDFSETAYLAQVVLNVPENPLRPPRPLV